MGLIIGPTSWWVNELAAACPVGTTLTDGSRIFCKAGGTAWIITPASIQISSQWANGKYNGIDAPGTETCCICDWSSFCTQLVSCGYNPCDWFIPNNSQVGSLFACRSNLDSIPGVIYSASEFSASNGYIQIMSGGFAGTLDCCGKGALACVRGVRCVTY